MTGEPHPLPLAELPAAQLTALHDLTVLLEGYERLDAQAGEGYERLDAQAGLDAQVRPQRDRLRHLLQLIIHAKRMLERDRPVRGVLIAISAQALVWAATLEADR